MKCILIAVIAALAVGLASSAATPQRTGDVSAWDVAPGDTLLFRKEVYRAPIADTAQVVDVEYTGSSSTVITGVVAAEQGPSQYPSAFILRGGLYSNSVTVRFLSDEGRGFNYTMSVYGREV